MTQTQIDRRAPGDGSSVLSLMDFSKGVAITWAVGYHGSLAKLPWFGWQAVHLFIVVSGFLLAYSCTVKGLRGGWGEWYVRRMHRLFPGYWLVCVAGFLVVVLLNLLGASGIVEIPIAARNLALQIPLLQNFGYRTMMAAPNAALWFMPLIVGFYLVFPPLFRILGKCRGNAALLLFLGGSLGVEFAYRAASLLWLDGVPVGFGAAFLGEKLGTIPSGIDRIGPDFPFQGIAPFGLFAGRLSEFVLGMVAAIWTIRHGERFARILAGRVTFVAGAVVWGAGNAMVYFGGVFWVPADAVITFGLVVIVAAAAFRVARHLPRLFRLFEALGKRSLEIYLVHLPVMQVYAWLYPRWSDYLLPTVVMFLLLIAAIGAAAYLLMRFEDSGAPRWIMRHTIDRVFGGVAS